MVLAAPPIGFHHLIAGGLDGTDFGFGILFAETEASLSLSWRTYAQLYQRVILREGNQWSLLWAAPSTNIVPPPTCVPKDVMTRCCFGAPSKEASALASSHGLRESSVPSKTSRLSPSRLGAYLVPTPLSSFPLMNHAVFSFLRACPVANSDFVNFSASRGPLPRLIRAIAWNRDSILCSSLRRRVSVCAYFESRRVNRLRLL